MGIISRIFSKEGNNLVKNTGSIIDNLATSDEEKLKAKQKISSLVFEALGKLQEAQGKIITSESNGNWLQRSWRPIIMLGFGLIVMYAKFIGPAFGLPNAELDTEFWELLKLGLGGYIIGRSTEKVAGTVTRGIDLPFLKKKDRKHYG